MALSFQRRAQYKCGFSFSCSYTFGEIVVWYSTFNAMKNEKGFSKITYEKIWHEKSDVFIAMNVTTSFSSVKFLRESLKIEILKYN